MNDRAYIGLVYSHSECVCGHHYTVTVIGPGTLTLVLDGGLQSCVVEGGGYTLSVKEIRYLLGFGTVPYVDNAGAGDTFQYMLEFQQFVFCLAYHV